MLQVVEQVALKARGLIEEPSVGNGPPESQVMRGVTRRLSCDDPEFWLQDPELAPIEDEEEIFLISTEANLELDPRDTSDQVEPVDGRSPQ